MSGSEASGPGRRLSLEEEQHGAELFGAGLSTRAVATELGVGNGTAARLKQRLAERAHVTGEPEETTVHDDHQDDDAELGQLQSQREQVSAELAAAQAGAAGKHQAADELSAERLRLIEDGGDATRLRPQIRDARDRAEDADAAADAVTRRLASLDQQIAAVQERLTVARLHADLAEAVAERDRVLAGVGERQRAAVLAVRTAAEEFTATFPDERDAVTRVDELIMRIGLTGPAPVVPMPVSTALWLAGDVVGGPPVSLLRAINEARAGNVVAVAARLGEVNGWLPPDPALLAAENERRRKLAEDAAAAEEAHRRRLQPGPVVRTLPEYMGASVSVDQDGNPLRPPDPERPRPQQVVRPGSLGFEPFPR